MERTRLLGSLRLEKHPDKTFIGKIELASTCVAWRSAAVSSCPYALDAAPRGEGGERGVRFMDDILDKLAQTAPTV